MTEEQRSALLVVGLVLAGFILLAWTFIADPIPTLRLFGVLALITAPLVWFDRRFT